MMGRSAVSALLSAALLCACSEAGPGACPARVRMKPASGWAPWSTRFCAPDCLTAHIRIGRAGRLRFEGRNISEAELRRWLHTMRGMSPQPIALVSLDPAADCESIGRVSRMIEQMTPCRGGYCYYGLDI